MTICPTWATIWTAFQLQNQSSPKTKSKTFWSAAKIPSTGRRSPTAPPSGELKRKNVQCVKKCWKKCFLKCCLKRDHKLTDEEIEFVRKLTGGQFAAGVDDTPEWEDLYSHAPEIHPINRAPESKASFIPSLDERNKVFGQQSTAF